MADEQVKYMPEDLNLARHHYRGCITEDCPSCERLAALIAQVRREERQKAERLEEEMLEARIEEARWWRKERSSIDPHTIERGNERLAYLERQLASLRKENANG